MKVIDLTEATETLATYAASGGNPGTLCSASVRLQ